MTIINEIRNHGYIAYVFKIVLLIKYQEKICHFMFFLTVYYSLKTFKETVL